jgi:hypothetical protein
MTDDPFERHLAALRALAEAGAGIPNLFDPAALQELLRRAERDPHEWYRIHLMLRQLVETAAELGLELPAEYARLAGLAEGPLQGGRPQK